jgi:hypothetical protein
MRVDKIAVRNISVSSLGNYIYDVDASVECFLPTAGMEFAARVALNRGNAHLAIIRNCLHVIFYSDKIKPPGTEVVCVLKEVKFQCGTYRATANLKEDL